MSDFKYMRLIVMFDMPTQTPEQKREYSKFRKKLLVNGYEMLQYSIYVRFLRSNFDTKKHLQRLERIKPKCGEIIVLQVTDHQFENMITLSGEREKSAIDKNPLTII